MVDSRGALLTVLLPLAALAAAPSAGRPPPEHHRSGKMTATSAGPYHITYPERVQYDGSHITHDVSQTYDVGDAAPEPWRGRGRRWRRGLRRRDRTAHYRLQLSSDEEVVLDVRPNRRLIAPGFVVERRSEAGRPGRLERLRRHCLMEGRLRGRPNSMVAISACQGLLGYIHTEDQQYIVEPVRGEDAPRDGPRPHLVYRRHAPGTGPNGGASERGTGTCRTAGSRSGRGNWTASERAWSRARRSEAARVRRRRSVSFERNVETLIVADPDVVQFYAADNLEAYLLTVMNGVAQLYHDASIGNAINVILVRIMVLEAPEDSDLYFNISGDGDSALKSFCNWQTAMNPSNESHPNHHDVAVLLTRRNICSGNQTCNTLGMAEVSGMCQPSRSCNINQDTGLSVSYTIAHELGHNFGMYHDGPGNGCDQQNGHRKHVMSPNLVNDVTPVVWSRCSRREITKFLDRDWGHCLNDSPTGPEYSYPQEPPGMLYDADHQCKLLYGPAASHCQMGNVCETLWCSVDGRCVTKLEPAAEGTSCTSPEAPDAVTWCSAGECVEMQSRPRAVDGGWGGWGEWSACSRTCGTGLQSSTRHCDRPVPANGGKYCVGERRRYRTCATEPCSEEGASFRAQQCSAFDTVPYQGRNYTWMPVYDQSYFVVAAVPVGARNIRMEELAGTGLGSFLSVSGTVRASDSDTGTGGEMDAEEGTADQPGELNANGEEQNETITIPGPLKSPLVLKVLLQGSVTRVRYEYTVPGHEGADAQVFSWRYQDWEECSKPCGGGQQRSSAACMEDEAGRVEDIYCKSEKPPDRVQACNEHDCPARWWTGPWSPCPAECGLTGNRTRSVHCVRSGKGVTTALSNDECDPGERPGDQEACRKEPADCLWKTGPWREKCSGGDSCRRTRLVWCPVPDGCGAARKPSSSHSCSAARCRRRHRFHHKRRRPHGAARDAPALTLLERDEIDSEETAEEEAPPAVSAHRGRDAARLMARLQNALPTGPLDGGPPGNYTWRLGDWGEVRRGQRDEG
ncbi:A disintegrin and metalloproteinase with thrombospondin motifs 7 [Amphibalanus amphitrite]|uniref:A disintegrin and metalloproteinase with thrombospondin motifs 7 n=1 Tax=Amphibalanus amphitrite TaxID=1232801 RepID=A0A6A4VUI1_AMPAM|nr:A disintegrin and metalloproteinase with thrombospondin motifs 7 [Amphibalanus amphitrite]